MPRRYLLVLLAAGVALAFIDSPATPGVLRTFAQEPAPSPPDEGQPEDDDAIPDDPQPMEAEEVVVRISNTEIEDYLNELGYEFEEVERGSYKFEMNGLVVVLFNGEINLQLYAGFAQENGLDKIYEMPRLMNEWNRTKRFSRAYLDLEGDPCIESDLDLEGGVTRGAIDEFLRTFSTSVTGFAERLNAPGEPADDRARISTTPRERAGDAGL